MLQAASLSWVWMKQLCDGFAVQSIDGRRVGTVASVGDGCLYIATDRGEEVCISDAAILAVERERVSLVCMVEGLPRYFRASTPAK